MAEVVWIDTVSMGGLRAENMTRARTSPTPQPGPLPSTSTSTRRQIKRIECSQSSRQERENQDAEGGGGQAEQASALGGLQTPTSMRLEVEGDPRSELRWSSNLHKRHALYHQRLYSEPAQ